MRLVRSVTSVVVMTICGTGACAAPNEGVERGSPVHVAYASAMTAPARSVVATRRIRSPHVCSSMQA